MPHSSEPVLIFDLDGTTLSINSFPHWAKHMLRAPFTGLSPLGRAAAGLRTAGWLVARKLGLVDHEVLKHALQAGWTRATRRDPAAGERYARTLLPYIRPELADLLANVAAGRADAVMATSAAADYARPLAQQMGFRHILATATGRGEGEGSNVGEAKRRAVLTLLTAEGWSDRSRILLTDHRDDLPLARVCDRTLWFGSEADLAAARAEAPELDFVYCGPGTMVTGVVLQCGVGAPA